MRQTHHHNTAQATAAAAAAADSLVATPTDQSQQSDWPWPRPSSILRRYLSLNFATRASRTVCAEFRSRWTSLLSYSIRAVKFFGPKFSAWLHAGEYSAVCLSRVSLLMQAQRDICYGKPVCLSVRLFITLCCCRPVETNTLIAILFHYLLGNDFSFLSVTAVTKF